MFVSVYGERSEEPIKRLAKSFICQKKFSHTMYLQKDITC